MELLGRRARQGDRADLRQHGGHLDRPGFGDRESRGERAGALFGARSPPERGGAREGEQLGEGANAAVQRLLEQLALGGDETMLLRRRFQSGEQDFRRTRLAEKAKNARVIDGRDGGIEIRVSGQQDPSRRRRHAPHLFQECGPVHARHAHVRHDDGERWRGGDRIETRGRTRGRDHLVARPQQTPQGVEHAGLVVDTEYPCAGCR